MIHNNSETPSMTSVIRIFHHQTFSRSRRIVTTKPLPDLSIWRHCSTCHVDVTARPVALTSLPIWSRRRHWLYAHDDVSKRNLWWWLTVLSTFAKVIQRGSERLQSTVIDFLQQNQAEWRTKGIKLVLDSNEEIYNGGVTDHKHDRIYRWNFGDKFDAILVSLLVS